MLKYLLYALGFILVFSACQPTSSEKTTLREGHWQGRCLQDSSGVAIPFDLWIKGDTLRIKNGAEELVLNEIKKPDSMYHYEFPVFNTSVHFKAKGDKLEGYWESKNTSPFTMRFEADYGKTRFDASTVPADSALFKRWKVTIGADSNGYQGVGFFTHEDTEVRGGVMMESGDIRYLTGCFSNNQLYLSTVNGGGVVLVDAKMDSDSALRGAYYSKATGKYKFTAVPDEDYTLYDADSLTYITDTSQMIDFEFPDDKGNTVTLQDSQFQNKVVMLELSGFWCSNCYDEAKMMVDFYARYKDMGLEIITIDYEMKDDYAVFKDKAARYRKHLGVDYTLLFGGIAEKACVAAQFPMVNKIFAYPTTITFDKKGQIRNIHAGFAGPSTGQVYLDHLAKTDSMIRRLLAE